MKYFYQTGWGVLFGESYQDCAEYDSREDAINRLKSSSDRAAVCCPLRVVDEEGKIHAFYDVDEDMRLPGCRWRKTEVMAYLLWEQAGRPDNNGVEFWFKAESLIDSNNQCVFVYD